jgi:hypothetical protein
MDDEDVPRNPPKDPGEVTPENEQVQNYWEEVVDDMEATAEQYRDQGWTVLECHPGDVVALAPDTGERIDRWGLDLLVPDDEFDVLHEWVEEEGYSFDAFEVFRAQGGGVVYVVVAMQDEATDHAVLFPAFYDPSRSQGMLDAAVEAGEMHTHLRPLSETAIVSFTQSDPSLFTA